MGSGRETLATLKLKVAALEGRAGIERDDLFTLGFGDLDEAIGGGLRRGVLHDLVAPGLPDCAALTGFAAALARRAAGTRAIVWARQDYVEIEAGRLDPHGLSELGLDPGGIVMVRARDPTGVLRAGAEAVRCDALGAVLLELWGAPKALDLTATRRLALSAAQSGVTVFLVHVLPEPDANAATSRWRVQASPSGALEANAPGFPVFRTTLLRHRAGYPEQSWVVEWDRDGRQFRKPAPLSRPVVSVPRAPAPAQAWPAAGLRRAG
jgi:protein ImuA